MKIFYSTFLFLFCVSWMCKAQTTNVTTSPETLELCNDYDLIDITIEENTEVVWAQTNMTLYYALEFPDWCTIKLNNVELSGNNIDENLFLDGTNKVLLNNNILYFEFGINSDDYGNKSKIEIKKIRVRIKPGEDPDEEFTIKRVAVNGIGWPDNGAVIATMAGNNVGDDVSHGVIKVSNNYVPVELFTTTKDFCKGQEVDIYYFPSHLEYGIQREISGTWDPVHNGDDGIVVEGNKVTYTSSVTGDDWNESNKLLRYYFSKSVPNADCLIRTEKLELNRVDMNQPEFANTIFEEYNTEDELIDLLSDQSASPKFDGSETSGVGKLIGDGIVVVDDKTYFSPATFNGITSPFQAKIRYQFTTIDGCVFLSDEYQITVKPAVTFVKRKVGNIGDYICDNEEVYLTFTPKVGGNIILDINIAPNDAVVGKGIVYATDKKSATVQIDPATAKEFGYSIELSMAEGPSDGNITSTSTTSLNVIDQDLVQISLTSNDNIDLSLQETFCPGDDLVNFTGFPFGGTFTVDTFSTIGVKGTVEKLGQYLVGNQTFLPEELVLSESESDNRRYNISYTVAGAEGCSIIKSKEFRVLKGKNQSIKIVNNINSDDPANTCIGQNIFYKDENTTNTQKLYSLFVNGDNVFEEEKNVTHYNLKFKTAGEYIMRLIIDENDNVSCPFVVVDTIRMTNKPQVDFSFEGVCFGSETNIIDLTDFTSTNSSEDTINFREWSFQSVFPKTKKYTTIDTIVEYPAPGVYAIGRTVKTSKGCSASKTRKIHIKPRYELDNDNFYEEDFEVENEDWVSSKELLLGGFSKNSFVLGNPDGNNLNDLSTTAWYTNNQSGGYNNQEQSWIEGPCLNLEGFDKPLINVDVMYDLEEGNDGALLQYTFDSTSNGSETWFTVGGKNQGVNGYTSNTVTSIPKNTPMNQNPAREGWTGENYDNGWVTTAYELDAIKNEMLNGNFKNVRFRVLFTSNPDNTNVFEGIAFDNIKIGTRNKVTLVEHFTNTNIKTTATNDALTALIDKYNEGMVDIRYHISKSGIDTFNLYNPYMASARSLYYGVEKPDRSVFDGMFYKDIEFDSENWLETEYSSRSLSSSAYEISIEGNPQYLNAGLTDTVLIKVKVTKFEEDNIDPNLPLYLHNAIVIDKATTGVGVEFQNVVRELLPTPVGELIKLEVGESQIVSLKWVLHEDMPGATYSIVSFLQSQYSQEVLQATLPFPLSIVPDVIEKQEKKDVITGQVAEKNNLEDFILYPVPVESILYIKITDNNENHDIQVYNALGKKLPIKREKLAINLYTVDVSTFTSGLYFMKIDGVTTRQFVKK